MITHYFRTIKDTELKQIDEPRNGIWIHVESPTKTEMKALVEKYNLDEAVMEDASDFFEMPRMEQEGEVTYFFTRYPFDEKDEDIDTAPILIAVGPTFVLTLVHRDVPFLNGFLNGSRNIFTTQKTKVFIKFMDALTKAYDKELIQMRKAVYRDRTRVRNISGNDIQRLVSYEHALNDTIAAVVPTNTWLKHLASGGHIALHADDKELMEDLMIDNNQLIESTQSLLKSIQNVRTASEATLTQRLNNTIQMLTALTVILTVPTIIGSFYGMNVQLPFDDSPYAFWMVMGMVAALMLLVGYYFVRKKWF